MDTAYVRNKSVKGLDRVIDVEDRTVFTRREGRFRVAVEMTFGCQKVGVNQGGEEHACVEHVGRELTPRRQARADSRPREAIVKKPLHKQFAVDLGESIRMF